MRPLGLRLLAFYAGSVFCCMSADPFGPWLGGCCHLSFMSNSLLRSPSEVCLGPLHFLLHGLP